jgi:hypothetical protein
MTHRHILFRWFFNSFLINLKEKKLKNLQLTITIRRTNIKNNNISSSSTTTSSSIIHHKPKTTLMPSHTKSYKHINRNQRKQNLGIMVLINWNCINFGKIKFKKKIVSKKTRKKKKMIFSKDRDASKSSKEMFVFKHRIFFLVPGSYARNENFYFLINLYIILSKKVSC